MTAAAFAGIVLAGGTRAIIAAVLSPPVILLCAAFAAVVLYVSRRLRQHGRTAPLQPLPPAEPMFFEGGHVIGRDGREAILARAREEDRAEADEFDFDALIAEWERQQGDGRG